MAATIMAFAVGLAIFPAAWIALVFSYWLSEKRYSAVSSAQCEDK
jgi:hypothetical protein